ncbi:MAG: tRNA (adenosine(37)-N6)-dimethylallyltransferase MiaA [Bacteroidales bacterium]|nr:tRNA (adenosine(37)-N6)-dimethylallyltransferase MiaA [Bacteroidales bacterium]
MKDINSDIIVVLGPTASGKTSFAAHLAYELNGEVISADSRQVYRNMNIGTGKDYEDYKVEGHYIPCHLIDIAEPGTKYNVYEFQKDFLEVYRSLKSKGKLPVLCGGSGLYIEAVLKGYKLIHVPPDHELRRSLYKKPLRELREILVSYRQNLHNTTDITSVKRAVRAIEIAKYYYEHPEIDFDYPDINPFIFGIVFDRPTQRSRITWRLKQRLENGMVEEVEHLMKNGLSRKDLEYYGLEYKYVVKYLAGELSYEAMFEQLKTAIHQFAKRQMTWFRRMERNGMQIHWIDGHLPLKNKLEEAKASLNVDCT